LNLTVCASHWFRATIIPEFPAGSEYTSKMGLCAAIRTGHQAANKRTGRITNLAEVVMARSFQAASNLSRKRVFNAGGGAHLLFVAAGAGSCGSCGRKSVGVPIGAAGPPPTHVGSYRGRPDCRLSQGEKERPRRRVLANDRSRLPSRGDASSFPAAVFRPATSLGRRFFAEQEPALVPGRAGR
jgi:hypothetical protein